MIEIIEKGPMTLRQYLRGVTERLSLQRERVLQDIGRRVALSVRSNFHQSVAPDGSPWAPLQRGDRKPLIKTGALLSSVDYDVSRDSVSVGYGQDYGRYHNEGTRWIPIRRFLGLRDSDQEMIQESVGRYVREAFS